METTEDVLNQITVASEAARVLQSEAKPQRPYAEVTLLRVAHILAILERSAIVTEGLLLQARSIVEASESTRASLQKGQHTPLSDEILGSVRATGYDGLVHHKLVRRFRRRRNVSIADIRIALDQLVRQRELVLRPVKTGGRDGIKYYLPPLQ
jgi:hypothetical protein